MSIAIAPAQLLTVEDWHDLYGDDEGRCELVCGRAVMSPTERLPNIDCAQTLAIHLALALGRGWRPLPGASVQVSEDPEPTMRIPDLVLVRAGALHPGWRLVAADVALVVEVVSPSSVETDWVAKRAEYAAAGIPNYLVVDVRFDDAPQLWLFDQIVASAVGARGAATTYPSYAAPTGDGTQVTIRIPGADPITITAAELT